MNKRLLNGIIEDNKSYRVRGTTTEKDILVDEIERLNNIINKTMKIYENKTFIEYKKKRFMENKNTSDLMYETLKGVNKE